MSSTGLSAVLLGPPGSGKGTQAERLSKALGVPAISTGEMLRRAVAAGSDLGTRVASVMAAGALVDDSLMAEVVGERLARPDASGGFLLDGYPRNLAQAETLDALLGARDRRLDAVILLEVPEEVLIRRALARQRADDREEVIRKRLRVYREATEPLVEHYDGRELLVRVDGDQAIEAVTRAALDAVERAGAWS